MTTYKVNADFTVNVNTTVEINKPRVMIDDDDIKQEAISLILGGDYEPGDPVCNPTIKLIEVEQEDLCEGCKEAEADTYAGNGEWLCDMCYREKLNGY